MDQGRYKLQSFLGYDRLGVTLYKRFGYIVMCARAAIGGVALIGFVSGSVVQISGGPIIPVLAALGVLAGYWITRLVDVAEYQLEFEEQSESLQFRSFDRKGRLQEVAELSLKGAWLELMDQGGVPISNLDPPQSLARVVFRNKGLRQVVLVAERQLLEPVYHEFNELIRRS